jgi:Family of unknown function (DUF5670)
MASYAHARFNATCATEQTVNVKRSRVMLRLAVQLHGILFVLLRNWLAVETEPARDNASAGPHWKLGQPTTGTPNKDKVHIMLYTIAVVLLILWVLGLVTSFTLGGFVHVLLVVAVVMILINLISGRRAL